MAAGTVGYGLSSDVWAANRRKLLSAAEAEGLKALILMGDANIVYSTGIRGLTGAVVLSEECGNYLLVALLDYWKALSSAPREFEVKTFYRGGEAGIKAEVPRSDLIEADSLPAALASLLSECGGDVGVDYLWVKKPVSDELSRRLGARARDASNLIVKVRRIKSDHEISLIEGAIRVAEESFREVVKEFWEGVSELEIAGRIVSSMMSRGAWGPSFPVIVAFYANSALPHHSPTQNRLSTPGTVLVDWGAIYEGYLSDMTRTWWWGGGEPQRFKEIIEDVLEAQGNAIDAVAPGVPAFDVDRAARATLEKRGLARYFIHGTGHGVGVEIHEEPYLRPASKDELEPGMVITIEPGVYLPGLYGIRIEDMVLVTKKGRRVLTSLSRTIAL